MRADRLISILMLLQIHSQLTANELSEKLEVSIRTIYRDIDTLSSIGIPIVTDRGKGGGIKLLGDYKTSLTGLTRNELRYIFINPSDKILSDLGIDKPNDSTFLKLLGNSSSIQREEVENIHNYIYIDMDTWNSNTPSVDFKIMSTLQDAIWNFNILKIIYRKIDETKEIILKPLGLVCKRGVWYLIGSNENIIKTYKVSSIESTILIDDTFDRPSDFNLEEHWKLSTRNFKSLIPKHPFTFKINPYILNHIKERKFITISKSTIKDDEIYLNIEFDSLLQGIEFAFGYGKDIEIIQPPEAISEIKKKSLEIINLY